MKQQVAACKSTVKLPRGFKGRERRFNMQVSVLMSAFDDEFDESLIKNVVTYVKLLPAGDSSIIDKTIFAAQMIEVFGISNIFVIDQMYRAAGRGSSAGRGVTIVEYCRLLCIFMSKDGGKKSDFAFDVYDALHSGCISRKEITLYMRNQDLGRVAENMNDDEDAEDGIQFLVQTVMEALDIDGNDCVDREEFQIKTKDDNLMRECLGACLPDVLKVKEFREMLENKTTFQIMQTHRYERRKNLRHQTVAEKESYIQSLYPVTLELQ